MRDLLEWPGGGPITCSDQSVPSLSNVAIRSYGGT
jgi:hypothetical protein